MRGQKSLDVPHVEAPSIIVCERVTGRKVLRHDTGDFSGTGMMMMVALKYVGTTALLRETFSMSLKKHHNIR